MNDYACILIWDAHTRMGHNIVPYAYGTSHTRMHTSHTRMGQYTLIWGRTFTSLRTVANAPCMLHLIPATLSTFRIPAMECR